MADQNVVDWSGNGTLGNTGSDGVAVGDVRPAELSDVDEIAAMTKAIEGENWSWTPKLIADNLSYFFVEGDPVHGFIRAEPYDGNLVLTLIAVKPEWHRKGVATRLLEALNDIGAAIDAEYLINCGPKTPTVFKLYKALGWKYKGDTPQGYKILYKEVTHVRDSQETSTE